MKSKGGIKSRSSGARITLALVLLIVLIAAVLWIVLGSTSKQGQGSENVFNGALPGADGSTGMVLLDGGKLPSAVKPVQTTSESGNVRISFSGGSADVSGTGAVVNGSDVIINRAGTYHLSGTLENGRIVVNAKGEDIVLILDGVNITCNNSSPLYIYKASSVTLIANGTTENVFTDGSSYDSSLDFCDPVEGEPNAAIFSKSDLIIRGTGSIIANGKYAAGIICKDNLKIINTNVTVDAVGNGINGKDSFIIQNSTVNVKAGKDGLRSTKDNDPVLGYAMFTDSNINIDAGDDGIQVETGLTIDNCSIKLVAGGGSSDASDSSQKGIKCNQGYITINSGSIILDCSDDDMNAYGDITVNGGIINLSTADDALHSDADITVNGGTIVVTKCHEGLEGMGVSVNGGSVYINAGSDGINAAGGSDGMGFDGLGQQFAAQEGVYIDISGGYVFINSDGDGIDSNGDVYMSGGTLIINGPTSGADAAIDYNGTFKLDGGVLLAVGSRAMAQAPNSVNQNCISVSFDGTVSEGTFIEISCGNESFVFKTEKQMENMIFSSAALAGGSECKVTYGGKYSGGENVDNVYSGGKYSGGSEIDITLDSGLSAYGQVGIGGSRGGKMFGGHGGMGRGPGMGGEPGENPGGQQPPEGGVRP